MLRKSVETRDWLNTIEPRNVRAVMKRVVEDITAIDVQVGQLYEEGVRKERSSDSSRRTHSYSLSQQQRRTQWSFTPRSIRFFFQIPSSLGGSPHGIVTNMLDCDIVLTEFELQLHDYIHIWTNALGKSMSFLIPPPAMG